MSHKVRWSGELSQEKKAVSDMLSVTFCLFKSGEGTGNGRVYGGCDTSFGVRPRQGMHKVIVHLRRTSVDQLVMNMSSIFAHRCFKVLMMESRDM